MGSHHTTQWGGRRWGSQLAAAAAESDCPVPAASPPPPPLLPSRHATMGHRCLFPDRSASARRLFRAVLGFRRNLNTLELDFPPGPTTL